MLELLTAGGKTDFDTDVISLVPEYLYVTMPDVQVVSLVPEYICINVPDTMTISMVPEYLYTTG